ncbi:MAG TPA: S8 family serine peptidase, partial [Pyrinomonadaceae bacterium]|nr:S8 family serine peptidase [Pyrinomonadaceae bacterium]
MVGKVMTTPGSRTGTALVSILIGWLCIVALIRAPLIRTTSAAVSAGKSRLLKHDRLRLIEAVARNKPNVTLIIAARPRMNESLASEIRELRGTVQYRDDDVDYLRVELPTTNVLKLSCSPAIESLNLTGGIDYHSLSAEEDEQGPPVAAAIEVRPPGADTSPINPYLPSAAIGAPQFIASHPTFDGRGVVVGLIDTNIDLLAPELQTAKTLEGKTVPKFADIVAAARNAIVPIDDASHISGYLKVDMQTQVTSNNTKLNYRNRNYTAPGEGQYRIGTLNERTPGPTGDLNRDGNPVGSNPLFDVLWNESTNTVWVDTNQNFDFADEKPMTDYHVRHDIGLFGKDDPKTAVRETVGFTLQTDTRLRSVFVIPGWGLHGTGVSGSAFGAGFFGGKMDGVAPGAQIISVPSGRGPRVSAAVIEGLITAIKDRRVDVVTIQFGNYLPQNDGSATFSIVADRLISKYQKLIFAAAGNGTDGLNAITSPADGREVMAVGSYISSETSKVNQGFELRDPDNMNGYTSHGPTKDGRLKPNLLAPTNSLTTRPRFMPPQKRLEPYELPPGYQIFGGTSTATPFAAAGAALLISAAKQSGIKYDARRLRWAMMSSARYLPKYRAELQGAGLLQIQAAWEALKNAPDPINIISRAPVKAVLSDSLAEPDRGAGIFEREGWTAGQSGRRTLSLTRISGNFGAMKFQLRWTGNDGTFAAPSEITLPLNTPVDVSISIAPKTNGVHSAVLDVVSLDGAVVHKIMNTVVAADQLTAVNNFSVTQTGETEWLHSHSYFVNVPPGTPALRVDVSITQGNVMPVLTKPNGRFYYSLARDSASFGYTRYQSEGTWSRVVSYPDPGVWQISLDNSKFGERPRGTGKASFTVTATLLGVNVQLTTPGSDLAANFSQATEIRYTNSHGSFVGEIAATGLASVFATDVTFSSDEPKVLEIDVAPGASRIGATVTASEADAADVDLYLFDCTAGECTLRDFSTNAGPIEQVAVDAPAAGKWKVIVDPFNARDPRHSFQYKDYLLHSAFGRVDVQNDRQPVPHGAVLTQPLNLRIAAVPVGPRHLEAMLMVIGRPGPNTDTEKKTNPYDLYYPDHAVLGVASRT